MARQKNPTALFDAIYSAKKPPKASPSAAIPTPKWWGKNKTLPKPPVPESTENVGRQRSWLSVAKKSGVVSVPVTTSASVETVAEQPVVEYSAPVVDDVLAVESVEAEVPAASEPQASEPKPRFIDRFVNRAPQPVPVVEVEKAVSDPTPIEAEVLEIKPEKPASRSREPRESFVKVDSAAREFQFRLSYGGLIAIGFILVMALAIAFVAGTRVSSLASSDPEDGLSAPKQSAAAHTTGNTGLMAAVGDTTPVEAPNPEPVKPDVLSIPQHPARPAVVDPRTPVPAPLPIKNTRDIGMMYVVVQSYPERDLAQRACDYMNQAGVPCTLVQGPAGWALNDWYSVIGLQPFNKHDPALAGYERAVRALGVKFTTLAPDQFQPQAYTWREDSDLSQ